MLYNRAVRLVTLGGLHLEGSDFARSKPLLLLCYLAVEGAQSRRVLAELFFADAQDPRDALSTTLRRLRRLENVVIVSGDKIAARVACDTNELLRVLESEPPEAVLLRYRGPFLEGLDLILGEELEGWVFTVREYLAARVREAHLALSERRLAQGDAPCAARQAERALSLAGAPELALEDYPRIYALLKRGKSPKAAAVKAEAEGYGIQVEAPETRAGPVQRPRETSPVYTLPAQASSFVGRDHERGEVAKLLREPHCRILTLHGPGGVGKSRLAIQIAWDQMQVGSFREGVFFVPLDTLTSSEQIPVSIAATLELTLEGKRDALEQIGSYLGDKRVLLVLDNFEQLLEGATLVSELCRACSDAKILVTSRERLNLTEEHVLTLEGLSSPDESAGDEDALASDAVQLLAQRAKKARLDFHLEPELPEALKLCKLLEGSPLGIELAAAWVRLMPLADIRSEVARNLDFLASSARNATGRHQSLRATFEHSWRLLSDRERRALAKLAVFRGGFRREAAQSVAGATLPILASLADKSLLRVRPNGRYDRHDLLHQFTHEKFIALREDYAGTRVRYANYYLELAEEAEPYVERGEQASWLARLEEEHANLQNALAWSLEHDAELGLKLAASLGVFWEIRSHYQLGRAWYEKLLSHPHAGHLHLRAKILSRKGRLADLQGDVSEAQVDLEESLVLHRKLGDKTGMALSLNNMGLVAYNQGEYPKALEFHNESLALRRAVGDKSGMADSLNNLGLIAHEQARHSEAHRFFTESVALKREVGDEAAMAYPLLSLSNLAYARGDYPRARTLLGECLSLLRKMGDRRGVASALSYLGDVSAAQGDYFEAQTFFHESLTLRRDIGDKRGVAALLNSLGNTALYQGDDGEARTFYEESLTLRREVGDRAGITGSLHNLGLIAAHQGRYTHALETFTRCLSLHREIGDKGGMADSLHNLGFSATKEGDYAKARTFFHECLALSLDIQDRRGIAETLEEYATLLALETMFTRSVRLFAAARTIRESVGAPLEPYRKDDVQRTIEHARHKLGDAFPAIWKEGLQLGLEGAVAYALSEDVKDTSRRV